MLTLNLKGKGYFNEQTSKVSFAKGYTIELEHSLIAISKWEEKYHKPFLDDSEKKTADELKYYIKCMTITPNIPDEAYDLLTIDDYKEINKYITDSHTATKITERSNKRGRKQTITNELIYSWMFGLQLPKDLERWHVNRLLILIRICNANNQPEKKMSRQDVLSQNSALNKARRAAMNSKG